jgi:hypothetical protein
MFAKMCWYLNQNVLDLPRANFIDPRARLGCTALPQVVLGAIVVGMKQRIGDASSITIRAWYIIAAQIKFLRLTVAAHTLSAYYGLWHGAPASEHNERLYFSFSATTPGTDLDDASLRPQPALRLR